MHCSFMNSQVTLKKRNQSKTKTHSVLKYCELLRFTDLIFCAKNQQLNLQLFFGAKIQMNRLFFGDIQTLLKMKEKQEAAR